jgi:hypothetical protein
MGAAHWQNWSIAVRAAFGLTPGEDTERDLRSDQKWRISDSGMSMRQGQLRSVIVSAVGPFVSTVI